MTRRLASIRRERGATLVVALIVLALITLLVVHAFTLSSSNLKAVGNMQAREEGIAAANQAIEQVVSSPFYNAPTEQTWNIDLDHDGKNDYSVVTAKPTCIRAAKSGSAYPSDVELGKSMSAGSTWNVDWDIQAKVTDSATGASVTVHQGVRTLLSQIKKESVCP